MSIKMTNEQTHFETGKDNPDWQIRETAVKEL